MAEAPKNNVLVKTDPVQDYVFTATEEINANTPYVKDGFHGMVVDYVQSGDETVMDIAPRVWQINVTGLTVARGTKIYITSANALSTSAGGNTLFGIAQTAKDSNNTADILLAIQA